MPTKSKKVAKKVVKKVAKKSNVAKFKSYVIMLKKYDKIENAIQVSFEKRKDCEAHYKQMLQSEGLIRNSRKNPYVMKQAKVTVVILK